MDNRMSVMETFSQGLGNREASVNNEGRKVDSRYDRRLDNQGERLTRQTKIEFPTFDGGRVQDWVFKSERFFELDDTPAELKVSIASVYLLGQAMDWHYAFLKNRRLRGSLSWEEYSAGMLMRFGPSEVHRPIAQMKILRKGDSYMEYVESFVSLVSKTDLSDEDQVAMFIEGLKPNNQKLIAVLEPRNLQHVIAIGKTMSTEVDPYGGRRQEEWGRTYNGPAPRGMPILTAQHTQAEKSLADRPQNTPRTNSVTANRSIPYQPPHKRVTPAEMEDRRSKGLCFWCEDKYTFGHKCANKRVYALVLEPDEAELEEEEEELSLAEQDRPSVSLHALHGIKLHSINQTMKLVGFFKKQKLHILVDSGSPHNFLDAVVGKRVGCMTQRTKEQKVMVANGDNLICNSLCRKFEWSMQGTDFVANVLIMPIKGCELILGMEWLNSLGVVKWDFPALMMEFNWQGKPVSLQSEGSIQLKVKEGKPGNWQDKVGLFVAQRETWPDGGPLIGTGKEMPVEIALLLRMFKMLFEEPAILPPHRSRDHCIPLEDGVKGVSVRPYRHSTNQKDAIEELVQQMLQGGLIQHSSSPFS